MPAGRLAVFAITSDSRGGIARDLILAVTWRGTRVILQARHEFCEAAGQEHRPSQSVHHLLAHAANCRPARRSPSWWRDGPRSVSRARRGMWPRPWERSTMPVRPHADGRRCLDRRRHVRYLLHSRSIREVTLTSSTDWPWEWHWRSTLLERRGQPTGPAWSPPSPP